MVIIQEISQDVKRPRDITCQNVPQIHQIFATFACHLLLLNIFILSTPPFLTEINIPLWQIHVQ